MQENSRRVDEERQELQTLVSDISHQVKTPVSNLKMATDTLLEKPMTEACLLYTSMKPQLQGLSSLKACACRRFLLS